jgi:PTS system ascorbate-specific IIA component
VLAPGIAMPHARPEEGAHALGLSLLNLPHGVKFNSEDNDPVYTVVMLAAPDKHSHIELISELAELFSNEEAMQKIHQAKDIKTIQEILSKF